MVIRNIGFERKMGDPKYRIWPVRGLNKSIRLIIINLNTIRSLQFYNTIFTRVNYVMR